MTEETSPEKTSKPLIDRMDGDIVTCPSGLRVRLRAIKLGDNKILSDRVAGKKGLTFLNLLRACTLEVIDPGPYTVRGGSFAWAEALVDDITVAIMALRVLTYGTSFDYVQTCSTCGIKSGVGVDVSGIVIYDTPAEAIDLVRAGSFVATKQVNGRAVSFRLLRSADNIQIQRIMEAERARTRDLVSTDMVPVLAYRIASIEGVPDAEKRAWLEDQPIGLSSDLIEAFNSVEGGADLSMTCACEHCGDDVTLQLPLVQMILPQTKTAR